MFSGIVEEVGVIEAATDVGNGRELVVGAEKVLEDLKPSDSISVDGVCQTVVSLDRSSFRVQTIATTLSRTTLGEYRRGRKVNLERPIAAGEVSVTEAVAAKTPGLAAGHMVSLRRT